MKIILGIVVTFVVAVFAIVLYPITFLVVILIHTLKARKIVNGIIGYESWLEKYKTIVRPFMLINGLMFLITSGVCFGLRVEGSVGLIYILFFIVGAFMATTYSLNIPIENNNGDIAGNSDSAIEDNALRNKNVLYKIIPTILSAVMCVVMVVQIANYTPPVAVIADEPANSQSISESVPEEKQQTPTASSEYNSSSAQEFEPSPEYSTSAPETPSAHSEESGAQTAQSIPPTASDTLPSKSQETESTPTPSAAPSANDGSTQGGNGNSSEAHFNDYDTPEQQNTTEYVLNTSTNKIHNPTCSDVKKIKPENYSTTNNLTDALNNGYVPCKRCSPN